MNGKEIFIKLEKLVERGDFNLDIVVEVCDYLEANGYKYIAKKATDLFDKYANEKITAGELKKEPFFYIIKTILSFKTEEYRRCEKKLNDFKNNKISYSDFIDWHVGRVAEMLNLAITQGEE